MTTSRSRDLGRRFQLEARARLFANTIFFAVIWPLLSIFSAALLLHGHPIANGVPFVALLAGSFAGAFRMLPEMIVVGLGLFLLSVLSFAALAAILPPREADMAKRASLRRFEPLALFLAAVAAVALRFPVVLRHPFLQPLHGFPVETATWILLAAVLLLALAIGWQAGGAAPAAGSVALAAAALGVVWLLAEPPAIGNEPAVSRQTVLFGVDSLAQTSDVRALEAATRRLGGIWYEKPVTPGLLTNSVWPALMMDRPVRETGIFFVFQKTEWARAPFDVARRAKEKGCRTTEFFSSRFTSDLGPEAGFDVDHSGPRGWYHVATSFVKDGSVLLPVLLPRLGGIPGAATPVNQSGTFSYDARREIHSILTAGKGAPCSFTAAHIDYLHETAYPRFSELSPSEAAAVRAAQVSEVKDLSLDWQARTLGGEPLGIEAWKLAHLQKILAEEIERTAFLAPGRNNKLILFSDHGDRRKISESNFGDPRYHRVVFATFGVPARDPGEPISLLDSAGLLGLGDPSRPERADPVVEYANATSQEWIDLIKVSHLKPNGEITMDAGILRGIGARLQGFRPYSTPPAGYFPAPVATPIPAGAVAR